MTDLLIGIGIGAGALIVLFVLLRMGRGKLFGSDSSVTIHQTIERMRAVGELVAFKVISRSIVTAESHPFGSFGKSWLTMFVSSKKMSVILEYHVDFKFDLRDPGFEIASRGADFGVKMPPCKYDIHVRDIKLYDEQAARVFPILLGDIAEGLGPGFSIEEKNRLIAEARTQVEQQALELSDELQSEVRSSATRTLTSIARGFGVEHIEVEFTERRIETPESVTVEGKDG